jgi:hypothetical protein
MKSMLQILVFATVFYRLSISGPSRYKIVRSWEWCFQNRMSRKTHA